MGWSILWNDFTPSHLLNEKIKINEKKLDEFIIHKIFMLKNKRRLCVSCYRQAKYKAGKLEGSLVEGKVVKQLVIYTWQDYYEKINMSGIRNGFQT